MQEILTTFSINIKTLIHHILPEEDFLVGLVIVLLYLLLLPLGQFVPGP